MSDGTLPLQLYQWQKTPPDREEVQRAIANAYAEQIPGIIIFAYAAHSFGRHLKAADLWKRKSGARKGLIHRTRGNVGFTALRWWQSIVWPVYTDQRDALLWTCGRYTTMLNIDHPIDAVGVWVNNGKQWWTFDRLPFWPPVKPQTLAGYIAQEIPGWRIVSPEMIVRKAEYPSLKVMKTTYYYLEEHRIAMSKVAMEALTYPARLKEPPVYHISPDRQMIAGRSRFGTTVVYAAAKPGRLEDADKVGYDQRFIC